MKQKLKFALSGALAGIANGLFGAGGGLFLVPLLTSWAKIDQRRAFACSIAIIAPMCLVSAAVYYFRSGLDLAAALPFMCGGLVGGFIGGRIFKKVPVNILRRIFALFILYGGIRSLL